MLAVVDWTVGIGMGCFGDGCLSRLSAVGSDGIRRGEVSHGKCNTVQSCNESLVQIVSSRLHMLSFLSFASATRMAYDTVLGRTS